ncbi:hypothetical protein [Isoptericola variabilis]|uniref:Integral membrane protein n=1 Tax=Isoptericola variabilis (strain 225) TaxID=743718 RepID=F6FT33_ISOV2|nr:hypothetical protein [Isoptericola variabilis]AEG44104.1 hypothetical protein Isova_1336 [Isoptericola variabilis 225]TWH28793.1 hypothetical protein L600_003800000270 [Isoptericola variabilis J7]
MTTRNRLAVAGLLVLAAVPVAAGAFRLTDLGELTPDNARFVTDPVPIVTHVVIQTPLAATSVTATYELPAHDDAALAALRYGVGAAMLVQLGLAVAALVRHDYRSHGAWMTRAYALGMGAGTGRSSPRWSRSRSPRARSCATWRGRASTAVAVGLLALLPWHRTHPRAVTLAVTVPGSALELAQAATGRTPTGLFTAGALVLVPYALYRWGSGRAIAAGTLALGAGVAVSVATGGGSVPDAVGGAVVLLLAMALGETTRQRAAARERIAAEARSPTT